MTTKRKSSSILDRKMTDGVLRSAADPRSDDELFQLALGDEDDHGMWNAIYILHCRATNDIYEKAVAWCSDRSPAKRSRGVDILAQLGIPKRKFPRRSAALWLKMLAHENNPDVLQSLGIAFSHNPNPQAISALVRLGKHKSADVRDAVVRGLMTLDDPRAIAAEIQLTCDKNKGIRDWATFAIGSMIETDSIKIRNALAARLNDSDYETRAEAAAGLAHRKDPRAFAAIHKNLTSNNPGSLFVEAAGELGDSRLLPLLRKLLNDPDQGSWGKYERKKIRIAIIGCKRKSKASIRKSP
jgi:HEAT repeat protein